MSSSVTPVEIESYATTCCGTRSAVSCLLAPSVIRRRVCSHATRLVVASFAFFATCSFRSSLCLVIRWRCPGCKKTFTQQPPFALSCKRYIREILLNIRRRLSGRGSFDLSQSGFGRRYAEIFHASTGGKRTPDDRSLAHSTPYRWINALGGFKEILRCAQDVILQKNPASTVCRDLAALEISPKKYVKAVREAVLKRCRQIIHLEAQFRATFGASIFPFFATRAPGDDLCSPPTLITEEAYEAKR